MARAAAGGRAQRGRGPRQRSVHSCGPAGPAQAPEPLLRGSRGDPAVGRGAPPALFTAHGTGRRTTHRAPALRSAQVLFSQRSQDLAEVSRFCSPQGSARFSSLLRQPHHPPPGNPWVCRDHPPRSAGGWFPEGRELPCGAPDWEGSGVLERSEGARPQSPRPQRRVWAGAPRPRPLPPPTPAASRSCARGGAQPGLRGPASVSPLTQWEGWTPVASGGHLRSHPWFYEQEISRRETAPPLHRSQNTLVSRIRDSSAEAAHLPGAPELPRHAGLSPPPRLPRHTPPCCPAGSPVPSPPSSRPKLPLPGAQVHVGSGGHQPRGQKAQSCEHSPGHTDHPGVGQTRLSSVKWSARGPPGAGGLEVARAFRPSDPKPRLRRPAEELRKGGCRGLRAPMKLAGEMPMENGSKEASWGLWAPPGRPAFGGIPKPQEGRRPRDQGWGWGWDPDLAPEPQPETPALASQQVFLRTRPCAQQHPAANRCPARAHGRGLKALSSREADPTAATQPGVRGTDSWTNGGGNRGQSRRRTLPSSFSLRPVLQERCQLEPSSRALRGWEEEPPTAPHLPSPLCAQEPSIAGPGPDTWGSPAGLGSDMEDLTAGAGDGSSLGSPRKRGTGPAGGKAGSGPPEMGKRRRRPPGVSCRPEKKGWTRPPLPASLPRGALGPRLPPIVQSGKLKSTSQWPRPSADISPRWPGALPAPGHLEPSPSSAATVPASPASAQGGPGGPPGLSPPRPPPGRAPRPVPATSAHRTRPRSAGAQLRPSPRPRRSGAVRSPGLPGRRDARALRRWKSRPAGAARSAPAGLCGPRGRGEGPGLRAHRRRPRPCRSRPFLSPPAPRALRSRPGRPGGVRAAPPDRAGEPAARPPGRGPQPSKRLSERREETQRRSAWRASAPPALPAPRPWPPACDPGPGAPTDLLLERRHPRSRRRWGSGSARGRPPPAAPSPARPAPRPAARPPRRARSPGCLAPWPPPPARPPLSRLPRPLRPPAPSRPTILSARGAGPHWLPSSAKSQARQPPCHRAANGKCPVPGAPRSFPRRPFRKEKAQPQTRWTTGGRHREGPFSRSRVPVVILCCPPPGVLEHAPPGLGRARGSPASRQLHRGDGGGVPGRPLVGHGVPAQPHASLWKLQDAPPRSPAPSWAGSGVAGLHQQQKARRGVKHPEGAGARVPESCQAVASAHQAFLCEGEALELWRVAPPLLLPQAGPAGSAVSGCRGTAPGGAAADEALTRGGGCGPGRDAHVAPHQQDRTVRQVACCGHTRDKG
ncbi:collagen alpha-1(I) chain-like [Ovis canadensis]|uniref:collagen alpha-1(I) chain-like n=1 Tax=Ovis canadensis TaxID=37174 RepID=UPI00375175D3